MEKSTLISNAERGRLLQALAEQEEGRSGVHG